MLLDRLRRMRPRPSTPAPSPDAAVLYPILHDAARKTPRRQVHLALPIKPPLSDSSDVSPSSLHPSPVTISPPSQSVQDSNGNPSVPSPTVSEISSSPDPRPRRDPTRTVHFAPKDIDPVSLASLPTDPALLRRHLLRLLSDRSECLRLITAFTDTTPVPSPSELPSPPSSNEDASTSKSHHEQSPSQEDLADALDPSISLPARLERALHTVTADLSDLRRQLHEARSSRDALKLRLEAMRAARDCDSQIPVTRGESNEERRSSSKNTEIFKRTMTVGPIRGDCVLLRQECEALRVAVTAARTAQQRAESERDSARVLLAGTLDDKNLLAARVEALTEVLESHADDARRTEGLLEKQKAAYEGALKETRGVITKLRGEAGELQKRVEVWKGEVRDRDHRHGLVVEELRKRGDELAKRVREFRDDWDYMPTDGGEFGGEIEVESVELAEDDYSGDVMVIEEEGSESERDGDSEKGDEKKGEEESKKAQYVSLLRPTRPLGPSKGLKDSIYVSMEGSMDNLGVRFHNVKEAAFIKAEAGVVKMACDLLVSGELQDGGDGSSWTFVYLQFPDGTSLTYLPLYDVKVEYSGGADNKEKDTKFGGFSFVHGTNVQNARISIAENVYEEIVLRGLYALVSKLGSIDDVVLPEVDVVNGRQMVDVSMMPTCSVEWTGSEVEEARVSDLMGQYNEEREARPIQGKALIALAFRSLAGETRLAMELVGMSMDPTEQKL